MKFVKILLILINVSVGLLNFLDNEQFCTLSNNNIGKCSSIDDCEYVIKLVLNHIEPQICGVDDDEVLFCCPLDPPVEVQVIGNKASEYCKLHSQNIDIPKEISFGNDAPSRRYIHMAALGFGEEEDMLWLCGGSLISNKFVLTAAHCLFSRSSGYVKRVRLGDLDISSNQDDADPRTYSIKNTIRHPEFNPPASYNDIALIELAETVVFSPYIAPACLHVGGDIKSEAIVIGWGLIDNNGKRNFHLQEAILDISKRDECLKLYPSGTSRKLKYGLVETQLCAGGGMSRKDTCMGDSGGPLQYKHNIHGKNGFTVFGITSFGKLCGVVNSPSVYTLVYPYIQWIESVVWNV